MSHGHHIPSAAEATLPANSGFRLLPKIGGAVGIAALAATFALGMGDTKQLYHSYLVGYLYWLAIALGCLFFVIILFATKAGWGVIVRRIAENYMSTLPMFAVLFIPVVLGMHDLFHHWTDTAIVAADPILTAKSGYLNEGFFFARSALYLVVWSLLSVVFYRNSTAQDITGDHVHTRRMQNFSYPAIALFALSLTFAAFDWIMSLDPHWYSTMFGVYYFAGAVVSMFAILSITTIVLNRAGALGKNTINENHRYDLGRGVFAFTVFWAYIAFSQYMLIWYANIPEETVWFEHRWTGSWQTWSLLLAIGHFAVPFFFMMPRTIKMHPVTLCVGSAWILLMQYVDLYWLVMPNLHHHGVHLTLVDFTAWIGIGGLFLAAFGWNLAKRPTIPVKDPRLGESLALQNY